MSNRSQYHFRQNLRIHHSIRWWRCWHGSGKKFIVMEENYQTLINDAIMKLHSAAPTVEDTAPSLRENLTVREKIKILHQCRITLRWSSPNIERWLLGIKISYIGSTGCWLLSLSSKGTSFLRQWGEDDWLVALSNQRCERPASFGSSRDYGLSLPQSEAAWVLLVPAWTCRKCHKERDTCG